MNTTVVTVDKEHPDEKVMEEAGRVLKEGGKKYKYCCGRNK